MRRFSALLLACSSLFGETTETLPIPLVEASYEMRVEAWEGAHLLDTSFEVILSEDDERLKMEAWLLNGKVQLRELDTYDLVMEEQEGDPCFTAYWRFNENSEGDPLELVEWDFPQMQEGIELVRTDWTPDRCEPIRLRIARALFKTLLFNRNDGSTPFDDAVNFIYYHTRVNTPKSDYRKILVTSHKDATEARVPVKTLVEGARQEDMEQLLLSQESQTGVERFVAGKSTDYAVRESSDVEENLQEGSWLEAVDWGRHKSKHPFFAGGILTHLGEHPSRTVTFKLHAAIWREIEKTEDVDPDEIRIKK